MKYFLVLLIFSLLIISSCKESDDPTEPEACDPNSELAILEDIKTNTEAGVVKVMTRNIYIGADVDIVLAADSLSDIPILAAAAYATLEATDFNKRAIMLADEIALAVPHVIGLQEVTMVYTQSPSDFIPDNPIIANDLEYDYLTILMAALEAKGLNYEIAQVVQNANIELPMLVGFDNLGNPLLDDIRIVDRDVLLVRSDVDVSNEMHGNFQAYLPVDEDLGLVIPRGYVSIEAKIGDNSYRVVNTHLEAAPIEELRAAQALELLAIHATETLPVIMLGDFNTPAPNNTTYQMVISAGYKDAWDHNTETYSYNAPGNTYGHYGGSTGDLSNTTVNMVERIDFVFVRSSSDPTWGPVVVVGDETCERKNNLWASDHAGVITLLIF